jgi:hypothetical protein
VTVSGAGVGLGVGVAVVGAAVPVEQSLVQPSTRMAPMPLAQAVSSTAQRTAVRRTPARPVDAVLAHRSVVFVRSMRPTVLPWPLAPSLTPKLGSGGEH